MQILKFSQPDFDEKFSILANRGEMDMSEVMPRVASIIAEIRKSGDKALCEQIARFDNWEPKSGYELKISTDEMEQAWNSTDEKLKEALKIAYERIKAYHEKQIEKSWLSYEKDGAVLGQKITPVDRAGLYIPGGKAAYPSSLLMNAVPAIVAGVGDISVCTPAVGGEENAQSPILLCYWFRHDLERIEAKLKELKVTFARIVTEENIRNWNNGKYQVGLIHPASAGHGLNLQQGGNTIVWFGLTWSLELYQQTNARLWRQGQSSKTVVVQHIVTAGTIDEDILDALTSKDASQNRLINAVKAHL